MSEIDHQPPCPSCGANRGLPRSITLSPNERTLAYVCQGCQHTWSVTSEDSTVSSHASSEYTGFIAWERNVDPAPP
jgi:hypothetical protein